MSRITVELLKKVNRSLVGRAAMLQHETELLSALDRPGNREHYEGIKSQSLLAAHLSYGIIKNHCFMDGNKRTAFLAANEFLRERGHKAFIDADIEAAAAEGSKIQKALDKLGKIHEQVAEGTKEVEDLAQAYAAVVGE